MLSQSVGNARETYAKWTTGAEKGAGAVEEVIQLAPSGVMTAGEMAMGMLSLLPRPPSMPQTIDGVAGNGVPRPVTQTDVCFGS